MFQTFILPILIFVGLGLLAGVLLSIASALFVVKTDEKAEKVRAALPGINCGACGYAGCDAYAKKVAHGGAKTNLCVPGGDAVAKEISEILGVEYEDVEEQMAFVRCNGKPDATSDRYEYAGTKTCEACNTFYSGKGLCDYGCLGFGDCVSECKYDAIHVIDGVAVVDRELCVGCGMCAKKCPKGLIEIVPLTTKVHVACANCENGRETRKVCANGCIACRKCEKTCPHDAIHVDDNLARIDYTKCTSCGACVEVCPVGCIHGE